MNEGGSKTDQTKSMTSHSPRDIKHQIRKKRTPMSCDRCKSRKTKCVDPVPGPCQYCQHIGAPCRTDLTRRKQRPYYQVSEEEYRYMTKLLGYYVPDRQLDLPTLKSLAAQLLERGPDERQNQSLKSLESSPDASGSTPDVQAKQSQDGQLIEEIGLLHEQLGCLMIDSRGKYRHVGADSGISFNAAVRTLQPDYEPESDKDIIPPLRTTTLPPETPESSVGLDHINYVYLPPRQCASRYISRFFDDVHCLYWFYSTEQFHTQLETTYFDGGNSATSSWLCSLYSIFALGYESGAGHGNEMTDTKSSADYLVMSKALVSRVCDEADLESVRALSILSLALQEACFSNASYLYMGTAVRIAFSLGLHMEKAPASRGLLEREHNRRMWWTTFILDFEAALRYGNPCAITDECVDTRLQFPSEQILGPGTNTPLGYLAASITLTKLRRRVSKSLYVEPQSGSHTVSVSHVSSLLSALHDWLTSLPSHLSSLVHVAPSHIRSVAILHLRYWNSVVLVTRPFLLYTVLRDPQLRLLPDEKREWFSKLTSVCVNAAQNALEIFKTMHEEHVLSSIITFDCTCLLELVQVFLLALAKTGLHNHREQVRCCLNLLCSMENIGWTKRVVPEVTAQLRENGILESTSEQATVDDDLDQFLDGSKGEIGRSSISDTHDGLDIDYSDLFFADIEPSDSTDPGGIVQQIGDLSRLSTFVSL